uniref:Reverse transcriptase domain-containing protein n=1 Tax=Tanacetum cinerariifolium TaxID=118510 RepID=A0A699TZR9_TANCI|nr:hypothetical protein [Tanacetum cinerariifolium]
MICIKFVANETEKNDKYVGGLPNNIYGSVKASKPKIRIMAPVTRQGPNVPPNNSNPNNMTSESVQAIIDQALL